MRIDFQPIASVLDAEEALAMIEVRTLFHAATYASDLEWDEDSLLTSFLERLDDGKAREDFREEPSAGIQEAKGRLLSDLYSLIEERHGALGTNSPFESDFANGLLLQCREPGGLTTIAIGYLWLSFFWLLQSEKDYVVIDREDRAKFVREFTAVFEQICCFVITGRTPSAIWYFGDSRNVAHFLARLERVTQVCGTGTVRRVEDLEANQVGANDAGVDVMAVDLQDGHIRRDALAYLIGATLQRTNRRGKIMGIPEVDRFTDYFQKRPVLAYKGVLAVPFPRSEIEELNCRDQDCLYLGREDILYYLGRVPEGRPRGYLRYPGIKLLRATELLAARLVMVGNDSDRKIDKAVCPLAP